MICLVVTKKKNKLNFTLPEIWGACILLPKGVWILLLKIWGIWILHPKVLEFEV